MKTIYLLIISILFICVCTNAQTWQWTHPEKNGDPPANAQAHDVEVDASGNVYVLGDFDDSLFLNSNFISKGDGSYLAKYDSTGKLLWYKLIKCTNTEPNIKAIRATDLTVNLTGVYITGTYRPSNYSVGDCSITALCTYKIGSYDFSSAAADAGLFITKFNTNGNVIWNKTATDPFTCDTSIWRSNIYGYPTITSDKTNNIICAFIYQSLETALQINGAEIPLRGGENLAINPFYLVVAKYNSSGGLLWSNYAGGGFIAGCCDGNGYINSSSISMTTDRNNNIFISGNDTKDSTYFGSQLFHTTTAPANGAYAQSTFIAKLSAAGTWQFAKELISSTNGYQINPDQLCADDQNNIYALANNYWLPPKPILILGDTAAAVLTNNTLGQYLVKIKNNGSLDWYKGFDGTSVLYTRANSICFANGRLYIAGNVFGGANTTVFGSLTILRHPVYGGSEYFVAKANTNGDFDWVATAGSTGASNIPSDFTGMEGLAVRVFNDNIYTAGYYMGGITTLGNMNGSYADPYNSYFHNIFFGKLKDQSIRVDAVVPVQVIPGCTITVPFTSNGLAFSPGNTFTAELSDYHFDFSNPIAIGSTVSTGSGIIIATIPANLFYSTYYNRFLLRIRSSDTLKTGLPYYAYADTGYALTVACPPAPSSGFTTTNIAATSATLNWTAVGCASGYKVQYRIKGTKGWTTANITANTSTLDVTGLTANTTYQWRVATKCKNNGITSFSEFSANKQFTTAASFAVNTADASSAIGSGNTLQIIVQPNPAKTSAILSFSGTVKNASITITDILGKTIWEKGNVNSNRIVIPVQNFTPGTYIIKVLCGNKTNIAKLVKE